MNTIETRSPALVLVLSVVTCGLFLIYWYYKMYEDLKQLTGSTPTGNDYILDFILAVLTCGIWGIYVDYKISVQIGELQQKNGLSKSDLESLVIILDIAAYITVFITYYISSAIQQDALNKVMTKALPPTSIESQ